MISKKEIQKVFDSAEEKFRECWRLLKNLKTQSGLDMNDLFKFQPTLAETLVKIGEAYQRLSEEKRSLIGRKSGLSPSWFRNRMRLIARYQTALKDLNGTGKMLGDAYAWLFYMHDRETLFEHSKKPYQRLSPTGSGGRGELAFISVLPKMEDKIVVFHGITTFLRLGDVSFVDLHDHKVKAIGELKSVQHSEKEFEISLATIGRSESDLKFIQDHALRISGKSDEKAASKISLIPKQADQLRRQIRSMGETMKPSTSIGSEQLRMKSIVRNIEKLMKGLKRSSVSIVKADRGLLLFAMKWRYRSLFSKFFSEGNIDPGKKLNDLPKFALQIMKDGSQHNQLILSPILTPNANYFLRAGMMPLCWWPLDVEIIEPLIFNDVSVTAIYNPAHLIDTLCSKGFEVEPRNKKNRDFKFTRRNAKNVFQLDSVSYYFDLITNHFFPEETIIDLICKGAEIAEKVSDEKQSPVRLDMRIEQNFGEMPEEN